MTEPALVFQVAAATLALVVGMGAPAQAQEYPRKTVRMIVPLAPGGAADFSVRMVAQELSKRLGQQFIVENRAGAATTIGTAAAAKSPPDGYTLLAATTSALAVSPHLYSNLAYNVLRDFVPIATMTVTSEFLVVHPSLPVKTVPELVRLARSRPGEIFYSSTGAGSMNHLLLAMFVSMTGTKMVHVPHKGGDASVMSVMSGETQVGADVMPRVGQLAASGRVRVIAVTGPKRSRFLPDVPTVREGGVSGYEAQLWSGVLAPADTPESVVKVLASAIAEVRDTQQMRERLAQGGVEVFALGPRQFAELVKADYAKWGKTVRAVGFRLE